MLVVGLQRPFLPDKPNGSARAPNGGESRSKLCYEYYSTNIVNGDSLMKTIVLLISMAVLLSAPGAGADEDNAATLSTIIFYVG